MTSVYNKKNKPKTTSIYKLNKVIPTLIDISYTLESNLTYVTKGNRIHFELIIKLKSNSVIGVDSSLDVEVNISKINGSVVFEKSNLLPVLDQQRIKLTFNNSNTIHYLIANYIYK